MLTCSTRFLRVTHTELTFAAKHGQLPTWIIYYKAGAVSGAPSVYQVLVFELRASSQKWAMRIKCSVGGSFYTASVILYYICYVYILNY